MKYFLLYWRLAWTSVVYRLGFAKTRQAARQFVNHGHILVNGIKVDIPSYQVSVGDEIGVREKDIIQTACHQKHRGVSISSVSSMG